MRRAVQEPRTAAWSVALVMCAALAFGVLDVRMRTHAAAFTTDDWAFYGLIVLLALPYAIVSPRCVLPSYANVRAAVAWGLLGYGIADFLRINGALHASTGTTPEAAVRDLPPTSVDLIGLLALASVFVSAWFKRPPTMPARVDAGKRGRRAARRRGRRLP